MKQSTDMQLHEEAADIRQAARDERKKFLKEVGLFLLLFIIIYLYFMLADLSSAPKFIYAQF